jgi:hypothetical protein
LLLGLYESLELISSEKVCRCPWVDEWLSGTFSTVSVCNGVVRVKLLTYLQCCKVESDLGSSEQNLTLYFLLIAYKFPILKGELRQRR